MTDIERRLRHAMHAAVDGEQPPPDLVRRVMRRHRRFIGRATAGAALATAMLVIVPAAIASLGQGAGTNRPGASRSPSAASPAPSRSAQPTPRLPKMMHGAPMPRTPGLRLLLAGRRPAWFRTATVRVEPISGLPGSKFPYTFARVAGGWAAQPSPKGPSCMATCPGPRLPAFFIADGSAAARRAGLSHDFSAASASGRLWLETYPRGAADVSTASASAQQVSIAGQPIGSAVRLPVGYLIMRGVGPDLLIEPVSQGPGPVIDKLWDPLTRQVVRTFANVIAASAREVAWGICGGCAVHVLDLPTGKSATIAIPARTWAYDGSFSADGSLLAVHLSAGVTPGGRATLVRIGVIDLARPRLQVLPGSTVGVNAESLSFEWQGTSHQLIAAVSGASAVAQVASWHPGAARLLVRTVRLPHGMTVVLGEYG